MDFPVVRVIWSLIRVIGKVRACEMRDGVIQKKDRIVKIGSRCANHIRNMLFAWVVDRGATIDGSKEENRSVITRARKGRFSFSGLKSDCFHNIEP
jgi:hypothetical protein